jgi:hypothetical protein
MEVKIDEEMWKQVNDFPMYSVSNTGKVRNDKTCRILKPFRIDNSQNNKNYFRVDLNSKDNIRRIRLHRLIAKTFLEDYTEDLFVDHIDRNRLNNHISNLRMVDIYKNNRNRSKIIGKSSIYKGVYYVKNRRKWIATIGYNHEKIYLGIFKNEVDAAKAYNNYIINNNLECYVLNEF